MSSLAVESPDPGFGVSAQSVTLVDLLEYVAAFFGCLYAGALFSLS